MRGRHSPLHRSAESGGGYVGHRAVFPGVRPARHWKLDRLGTNGGWCRGCRLAPPTPPKVNRQEEDQGREPEHSHWRQAYDSPGDELGPRLWAEG